MRSKGMIKVRRFLLKHVCKIVIGFASFLLFVLFVPFIINVAFQKPALNDVFISKWGAGDALGFYGSIIAAIGTIVLGYVAVSQNRKAHDINVQMQRLQQAQFISMVSIKDLMLSKRSSEQSKYRNAKMPNIDIAQMTLDGFNSTQFYHIDVEFVNSSEYPIVQLLAHAGKEENANCLMYGIKPHIDKAIYIEANGIQCIRFIIPCISFENLKNFKFYITLRFINVFDYQTKAFLYIDDLSSQSQKPSYQYRLAKFTDIRPKEVPKDE